MEHRVTKCFVAAAGLLLANQPALAGQVYGTVEEANHPIQNKPVRVVCPGNKTAERNTDRHGSYSVYVDGSGKCNIWVNGIGPLSVRVYDEEVRYDLRVSGNKLQRK